MTANIPFNAFVTTNAVGSFNVTSSGLIVGTAYNDPAVRYQLVGGVLATTETLPMPGGVGINTAIPNSAYSATAVNGTLGPLITRALNLTQYNANALTGFSVFDQAHAMINSPQSPVPLSASGGFVNYYELGSRARIAVQCSAALTSLVGGTTAPEVSWDFVNQMLVPYTPGYSAMTITTPGSVWSATNGGQIVFTSSGGAPSTYIAVGDNIIVSGIVCSPTSPNGYNGTWVVTAVTSTTVTVAASGTSAQFGSWASAGTVNAAVGGALPVVVKDIDIGNSMVPVYSSATGFWTWSRNGNAAVIEI
jgi:hypothetical protein